MISLTCYGGVGEIGGNKILLEDGGTRLMFDFGTPFGQRYKYFEEYLKPRSGAGLLDILELGLLPPLQGIYREDLDPKGDFMGRFRSHRHYRELSLDGVLISHAHVDHSGYVSFLRGDTPIYTTAMTAFIAKAMQDTGQSDFEKEVCYLNPRQDSGDGYLAAAPRGHYLGRPFVFINGFPEDKQAETFWARSRASTKKLELPHSMPVPDRVGALALRYFPVDHSIFGASAFAVETSEGWVAYTGDLRLHGRDREKTERFIREVQKLQPLALLCEGTRAGEAPGTSEDQVADNVRRALGEAKGLVVADFGPRNVERLITFLDVAGDAGRSLVILTKDAYLLDAMHLADPAMPCPMETPALRLYQDLKDEPRSWEKGVLERYASRMVDAGSVRRSPGDYVLCFSFWDIKNLIDIRPQGGTYIYSSSEAYNEEQEMDLRRLHNWLDHFGLDKRGLPDESGKVPEGQRGFHSSGHASALELADMVKRIQPRWLVPIHTELPGFFVEALANSKVRVAIPSLAQGIALSQGSAMR